MLKAGPFFTIQVKSSYKPLEYKNENQIAWLHQQENPFFVAVATADRSTLEVFSTWRVLSAFLKQGAERVKLHPTEPLKNRDYIHRTKNNAGMDIYLGKPVVTLKAGDIADKKYSANRASVLREWVLMDRENITRRGAKMYWVIGPEDYETDKSLKGIPLSLGFFWNVKNLPDCFDNLVRCAIALRLVMKRRGEQRVLAHSIWKEVEQRIEELLITCQKSLTPSTKDLLRQKGNLDLG